MFRTAKQMEIRALAGLNESYGNMSKEKLTAEDIAESIDVFDVDVYGDKITVSDPHQKTGEVIVIDLEGEGVTVKSSEQTYLQLSSDDLRVNTTQDLIDVIQTEVIKAGSELGFQQPEDTDEIDFVKENTGEKNNSLESSADAESNTYSDIIPGDEQDEEDSTEEDESKPCCDSAKEAINQLKSCIDNELEEKIELHSDPNNDHSERGKLEFYTKVKEAAEKLVDYLNAGDAGYRKAGVFLNSLSSQMQEYLPRDLWTLLTYKPTLGDRFKEIETKRQGNGNSSET